jgi:hypothetical protein
MNPLRIAAMTLTLVLAPTAALASDADPETSTEPALQAETAGEAGQENVEVESGDTSGGVSIMEVPLDGSSVESFTAGLARVEDLAAPYDYDQLEKALQWLMVYDIAAKNNKELLYQRLDGNTPNQIIEKIKR